MIELLADHPEVIPTLAEWYEAEWPAYYGPDGPGDALADLRARCHRDQLPLGLVALVRGRMVGTAALDLDVTTLFKPSIVGLLVAPEHRHRGYATQLIRMAIDEARALKYNRIYLSSTFLGELLDRLGWTPIETVQFLNSEKGVAYMLEI